jgi:cholesterol transport system auxiliary component
VSVASLRRVIAVGALSMPLLGCALFTKSDPVVLRYFTPEAIGARPDRPGAARATAPRKTSLELRMGRINAASYVKDRIAFRDKSYEIGYYEKLRWTEKPEAYLRRALARALFEEQGVHQIISGPGTTMDVDLDAFEELRSPRHAARMQVTWALRDDQRVQFQETFVIERPLTPDGPSGPEAIAAAMAQAFDASVERVVAGVMAALSAGAAGGMPAQRPGGESG